MTSHWIEKYIGLPWEARARGPDAYDCWHFFRLVLGERYGIDVPVMDVNSADLRAVMTAFDSNEERGNWRQITEPKDGCGVELAHNFRPSHVGIWVDVDGGGVLHCAPKAGVVFQPRRNIASTGYNVLGYWEHR